MALNSSGPISLAGSTSGQSIAVELGQSASGQISLNDTNVRTLAGVPSGQITMPTNFWGKSSESGWLTQQYQAGYLAGNNSAGGANILSDGSFFFTGSSWDPGNSDLQYANGLARYTFTTSSPTQVYSKYYAISYPGAYGLTAAVYSSYDESVIGFYSPGYSNFSGYQKVSTVNGAFPAQPTLLFGASVSGIGSGNAWPSPSHARDSSGNFYTAVRFIYFPCCDYRTAMGVVKFDTNGSPLWAAGQNPVSAKNTGFWTNISLTPSGGHVYVSAGLYNPSETYSQKGIAVAKLDSSGSTIWSYAYTQATAFIGSVTSVPSCTDSSDNVYLVTNRGSTIALHKIDSSGNYQWGYETSGSLSGSGSPFTGGFSNPDIIMGSDGYIYVAVSAARSYNVNLVAIFKFDTSGNLQWVRSIAPYFGTIAVGGAPGTVVANKVLTQNSSSIFLSLTAQLGCNIYMTITGKLLKSGAGAKANVFGGAPGQEVGYFNETGMALVSAPLSTRDTNNSFIATSVGGSSNLNYYGPYDTGRSPTVGLL